jgi:hypothetical protein
VSNSQRWPSWTALARLLGSCEVKKKLDAALSRADSYLHLYSLAYGVMCRIQEAHRRSAAVQLAPEFTGNR